jgi:hypothetical protein
VRSAPRDPALLQHLYVRLAGCAATPPLAHSAYAHFITRARAVFHAYADARLAQVRVLPASSTPSPSSSSSAGLRSGAAQMSATLPSFAALYESVARARGREAEAPASPITEGTSKLPLQRFELHLSRRRPRRQQQHGDEEGEEGEDEDGGDEAGEAEGDEGDRDRDRDREREREREDAMMLEGEREMLISTTPRVVREPFPPSNIPPPATLRSIDCRRREVVLNDARFRATMSFGDAVAQRMLGELLYPTGSFKEPLPRLEGVEEPLDPRADAAWTMVQILGARLAFAKAEAPKTYNPLKSERIARIIAWQHLQLDEPLD